MALAHESHQGIVRTKARLRHLFWWLKLDTAVEIAPLNPVPLQKAAWEKLAIDIVGPLQNARYVKFSQNATTKDVIQFLKEIFSREGLPSEIVSDNGVQFISNEFKQFLNNHAIRHCRTSLYYPQANGEVERFNRVLKDCLQLATRTGRSRPEVVSEFLMHYRATPHAVTGETPSLLLHGQTLKTKLDSPFSCFPCSKPDEALRQKVVKKQQHMRSYCDRRRGVRLPNFKPGDMVRIRLQRTHGKGPAFSKPVQISSKVNYATYKLCDGRVFNAANLSR
uniref:Integrase catalytic domain-containing protein n=1 Tax=Trichuris muris TaxID=70415 RepID=A0A5S6QPR2_TRIMR